MSVCDSGDVKLDAAVNNWLKLDKVSAIFFLIMEIFIVQGTLRSMHFWP